MCAVVRLGALMTRQAAQLITNPPIVEWLLFLSYLINYICKLVFELST
jgi:hypothetical protein